MPTRFTAILGLLGLLAFVHLSDPVAAGVTGCLDVDLGPSHVSADEIFGDGHSQSWDGRIFIKTFFPTDPTDPDGWGVSVLRPEGVQARPEDDGAPWLDEGSGAFSPWISLQTNAQANQSCFAFLNTLAIVPDPTVSENPYRSLQDGTANRDGSYETYKMVLIAGWARQPLSSGPEVIGSPALEAAQTLRCSCIGSPGAPGCSADLPAVPVNGTEEDRLVRREATIVVRHPRTPQAAIDSATIAPEPTGRPTPLLTVDGQYLRGLEPTLTLDGHLLIYQGHPQNNHWIGQLMYSVNPNALAAEGWSTPKSILEMHQEEVEIAGVPFRERYPLAAGPLRRNNGQVFSATDDYAGAYPWVSFDGTELFHTTHRLKDGCDGDPAISLRGGLSVIGRSTGYQLRHIDGPLNPNRGETPRLIFSSPGSKPGMWDPYRGVRGVPIPYTTGLPVYPLFGSNGALYGEVSLEDHADGEYVLFLRMNESLRLIPAGDEPLLANAVWNIETFRTPDTSGKQGPAWLCGAKFPEESLGASWQTDGDYGVGGGKTIFFRDQDFLEVEGFQASFDQGMTVELWVYPESGSSGLRYLVHQPGSWSLALDESARPRINIPGRVAAVGETVTSGEWTHIAVTYDPSSDALQIFQNGLGVEPQSVDVSAPPAEPSICDSNLLSPDAVALGIGPSRVDPLFVGPAGLGTSSSSTTVGLRLDDLRISRVVRNPDEIYRSAAPFHGPPALQTVRAELTVTRLDAPGSYRHLAGVPDSWEIGLESSGQIRVTVHTESGTWYAPFAGTQIGVGEPTRLAFDYFPETALLEIFQDDVLVRSATLPISEGRSLQPMNAGYQLGGPGVEVEALTVDPPVLPFAMPPGLDVRDLEIPRVVTSEQIALGKQLFFDRRLSAGAEMSCSSCHQPDQGFSDGRPKGIGAGGIVLQRNTPTSINRAFSTVQHWDGKAVGLEAQAALPIEHVDEMGLGLADAAKRLQEINAYAAAFESAYGAPPSEDLLVKALADYQRSLVSGGSAVDLAAVGQGPDLSDPAERGRLLFHGKARCVACHGGNNFTDEQFHNTGFRGYGPTATLDPGLAGVTGRASDEGRFKTPTLRDITASAPYLHDGSVESLREVVEIYNAGGRDGASDDPNLDPEIYPLGLTSTEIDDVVAFLESLDGAAPGNSEGIYAIDRTAPTLPEPSNVGLVEALYLDLLDRPADPGGRDFYVGQLESGMTQDALVDAVIASAEHRERRVRDGFRTFLDRDPDPAASAFYRDYLATHTLRDFWLVLAISQEYRDRFTTDAGYITAVFLDVLGRAPDAEGLAHYEGVILSEGADRVPAYLLDSPERRSLEVVAAYRDLLGREPTPTEASELAVEKPTVFELWHRLASSEEYRWLQTSSSP